MQANQGLQSTLKRGEQSFQKKVATSNLLSGYFTLDCCVSCQKLVKKIKGVLQLLMGHVQTPKATSLEQVPNLNIESSGVYERLSVEIKVGD